ncbi:MULTISPECIES: hypothetical protein [Vibrio]|uniref:hypothetical protein n=1 Tax=Vibrio TaxID=662 RepID=UPI000B5CC693|nr:MULTISPECIES: hypothetical protein [Vibrio]HBV76058.1 hypothetical protein [Vibrio sp.]
MFDFVEWSHAMAQFHFLRPWWLIAFFPFIGLLLIKWKSESQVSNWQKKLPNHLRVALTVGENGLKRRLPIVILSIIIALAILVCSGPTWKNNHRHFIKTKPL